MFKTLAMLSLTLSIGCTDSYGTRVGAAASCIDLGHIGKDRPTGSVKQVMAATENRWKKCAADNDVDYKDALFCSKVENTFARTRRWCEEKFKDKKTRSGS